MVLKTDGFLEGMEQGGEGQKVSQRSGAVHPLFTCVVG